MVAGTANWAVCPSYKEWPMDIRWKWLCGQNSTNHLFPIFFIAFKSAGQNLKMRKTGKCEEKQRNMKLWRGKYYAFNLKGGGKCHRNVLRKTKWNLWVPCSTYLRLRSLNAVKYTSKQACVNDLHTSLVFMSVMLFHNMPTIFSEVSGSFLLFSLDASVR